MNKLITTFYFGVICYTLTACKEPANNNQQQTAIIDTTQAITNIRHCVYADDTSKLCKCPAEYELKDSSKLTHIKDQFYRNKTGHLYEMTIATKEMNRQNTLVDVTYFNGYISQEIDPLTFEPLDGWYAKDKNYVYYYRPVSGGMEISEIDTADTKTFKLLAGHYKYAMDKNFFYDETQIISGFIPGQTNIRFDKNGQAIEMTCKSKTFKFETVD